MDLVSSLQKCGQFSSSKKISRFIFVIFLIFLCVNMDHYVQLSVCCMAVPVIIFIFHKMFDDARYIILN